MRNGRAGLWCAIAFFLGCVTGLGRPVLVGEDGALDLVLEAAVVGFGLAWTLRRHRCAALGLILASVTMLGWCHAGHLVQREATGSVIDRIDDQPELVRFEAELLESFLPPDAADTDLLDRFQPDADDPPWRAQAELRSVDGSDGRHAVNGRIVVVAPAGAAALEVGSMITGVGWISGIQAPRNPGEHDLRAGAWQRSMVGRLKMDVPPRCAEEAPLWLRLRGMARRWIDANLLAALDAHATAEVRTLVVAMTTGRHLPGYASLRATFARTGLSHFLAISGFNVAVLFAVCVVLMELMRVPGFVRGPSLLLMGVLFLTLVDVEVSVLRAGLAGMLVGASMWLGRGWRGDGTLGTAALVTMAMDPWSASNPGFQLSYAAVLALRHGSGPVDGLLRACMIGLRMPTSWVDLGVIRGVRLAFAASVAAWLVSTPITLACMGNASPWCAVASTLLGPLAAVITVIASIATVLGGVPWMGWVLGLPMAWTARAFLALVEWVGGWPACTVRTDPMAGVFAMVALVLLFMAWSGWTRGWWRPGCVVAAALTVILGVRMGASMQPTTVESSPAFRWISLAIGDGSVHLLEADGVTVLFDAGSISRPGVGSAVVAPALRALGVSAIHTIVISHPHLDHFSAVPEVVEAVPVGRVVVTEAWGPAEARPGAVATLVEFLRSRGVPLEHATEGWSMRQGAVRWMALHPPAGFRATAVNDGSLGFLLRHESMPDRPLALLVGDAQDAAIARYLKRRDLLRPWVMELPHHGGWRPLAQTLLEWVHPFFVMQSTGQRRFARDRLSPSLAGAPRGVTCRDGALRFSWSPGPTEPMASLERWTELGWRPLAR